MAVTAGCGTKALPAGDFSVQDSRLRGLIVTLTGTASEQNAVSYLKDEAFQSGYEACMGREGFAFARHAIVTPYLTDDVPLTVGSEWLTPPAADFGVASIKVAYRLDNRAGPDSPYLALSAAQQVDYDSALDRCSAHETEWTVNVRPASAQAMSEELAAMVGDVEQGLDTGAYARCLADAGYEAATYAELVQWVWAQFGGGVKIPPTVDSPEATPEWNALVALERSAAADDARCRAVVYEQGLAALAEPLDSFTERHAAELAQLPAEWASLEQRARADGFADPTS